MGQDLLHEAAVGQAVNPKMRIEIQIIRDFIRINWKQSLIFSDLNEVKLND